MQETIETGKKLGTADIARVMQLLPHRYPFLLIDRLQDMDGDESCVGIKNVTINEPFFQGHFPQFPVMPGVLIIEGLAQTAGALMGIKTVLNEFLAYLRLVGLPEGALSGRSSLIMIYSLCGFANFGSLGIMLGGMGTMVPGRRAEIAALGFKSIIAGTLATLMTGAIVGILTPQ